MKFPKKVTAISNKKVLTDPADTLFGRYTQAFFKNGKVACFY